VATKETYRELLKHPNWQRKRLEILERDHFTCVLCGDADKTLHVHHWKYVWGNKPWEYDNYDLATVCEDCHAIETEYRKAAEERLLFVLRRGQISARYVYELAHALAEMVGPTPGANHVAEMVFKALRMPGVMDALYESGKSGQPITMTEVVH
jgi:hypothetical protein